MLEILEDRTVPSTILWTNRGSATNDSDGFAGVFGANAGRARAVVDAALRAWQDVIVSFNYSAASLNDTFRMTVNMAANGTNLGASAGPNLPALNGKPTSGTATIGRGNDTNNDNSGPNGADIGDGAGWFLDPTPGEHSEFLGTLTNAYSGLAPALNPDGTPNPIAGLSDLYTVVLHEFGHALGLVAGSQFLLQSGGLATLVRDNNGNPVSDTDPNSNNQSLSAAGNIVTTTPGFLWRFDGPSVQHLMTSYNSQPAITLPPPDGRVLTQGVDGGFIFHSAAASQSATVTNAAGNNVTYVAADDLMNPRYSNGQRRLIPDTMVMILQDAYGFEVNLPRQTSSYYAVLNQTTRQLLIRGKDASSDVITVTRGGFNGNALHVVVDIGTDDPGTGSQPGAGNQAAFEADFYGSIKSIVIQSGSGNDRINIDTTFADLTIDAGAGDDTINIERLPKGTKTTIDGGSQYDQVFFSPKLGDLNNIRGKATVDGGAAGDDDKLVFNDWGNPSRNRSYRLRADSLRTPGQLTTIGFKDFGNVYLDASPADNTLVEVYGTATGSSTIVNGAAIVNVGGPEQFVSTAGKQTRDIKGTLSISNLFRTTALTIDDSSTSGIARNVTLTKNEVCGLSPEPISFAFAQLSSLKLNLGSAGNTVTVHSTRDSAIGPITVNTGLGADTVNVQLLSSAVTVNGQKGADTVNVGLNGNMEGIAAQLFVTNAGDWSTLNLDNSASTQPRSVNLSVIGSIGKIAGLAPAAILYRRQDLRALNLWGGLGNNTYDIVDTAQSTIPGGSPTTLYAGNGLFDTINVSGTTGALTIDPQGSFNQVFIGARPGQTGSLNRIRGDITLGGPDAASGNFVDVFDQASTGRYTYHMDEQRLYRTSRSGSSPTGSIYYGDVELTGLALIAPNRGHEFRVNGTPDSDPSVVHGGVSLLTGDGNDTVTVTTSTGQVSSLTVTGGNGTDLFEVHDEANPLIDDDGGRYEITDSSIRGAGQLFYSGIEDLRLFTSSKDDLVTLLATNAATAVTIRTNDGQDTVAIGGDSLDPVQGPVSLNGGAGVNSLIVNDSATRLPATWTRNAASTIREASDGAPLFRRQIDHAKMQDVTINAGHSVNTVRGARPANEPVALGMVLPIGGSGREDSSVMATDAAGSIYVAGYFEGTLDMDPGAGVHELTAVSTGDAFLAKYSPTGGFLWARQLSGGVGGEAYVFDTAVDSAGNVFVSGYFSGALTVGAATLTSAGSWDGFLTKLDAAGNVLWASQLGGPGYDFLAEVAFDALGNAYVAGLFTADAVMGGVELTSEGAEDGLVAKVNAAGGVEWVKSIGGTGFNNGWSLAADSAGNLYLAGAFMETVHLGSITFTSAGAEDAFLARLDSAGNFVWAQQFGGTEQDYSQQVAVDAAGNVYLAAAFNGTATVGGASLTSNGGQDEAILKFNSAGQLLWSRSMGGVQHDIAGGLAVSAAGNVYFTGWFAGPGTIEGKTSTATLYTGYLGKLDAAGNTEWMQVWGNGTGGAWGYAVLLGQGGSILVVGGMEEHSDQDPGAGTFNMPSAGDWDAAVYRFTERALDSAVPGRQ